MHGTYIKLNMLLLFV